MSILSDIPIVGSLVGGGSSSSGGIIGGALDMTGIPQLLEEGLLLYIGVTIAFKLIDKI